MQRKAISFKGQKIYAGIDVHKSTWTVTTIPEIGTLKTHSQKASAQELFDFLNRHYPEGDYFAVYEADFSGYSTYYSLSEYGIECIVVNAADVPTTQYEEVMKSDPVDSVKLAKSLRADQLNGIYIRERENLDDRSLVRIRKMIQRELARYKNRVKHMLYSNDVTIPHQFDRPGYWPKAFIKWLREEVVLLSSTRTSLDILLGQVEVVRKGLMKATLKVRHLSKSERYSEKFELIRSVPGIGLLTAMTILTEVYDVHRFRNEKQFASYLGLIPTSHSSGSRVIRGEKTFRGNKQIGPMLIEASWIAINNDDALALAYSNYRKKGLTPPEAIVRVARKLSNIIFSVLKNGKKYEPFEGN